MPLTTTISRVSSLHRGADHAVAALLGVAGLQPVRAVERVFSSGLRFCCRILFQVNSFSPNNLYMSG